MMKVGRLAENPQASVLALGAAVARRAEPNQGEGNKQGEDREQQRGRDEDEGGERHEEAQRTRAAGPRGGGRRR